MITSRDYHRAVTISKMRQHMRYNEDEFRRDWETAIALAQLMAVHGDMGNQEDQLDSCMQRVTAYLSNNPEARPW